MDGPERGIGSGGECCGLFCFVFTFTFIFALTFSSRGVRGTGVSGCVFTFTFAFAFIVKERGQKGLGGCGYVILPGGGVAHLKREGAWSPKGLPQAGGR